MIMGKLKYILLIIVVASTIIGAYFHTKLVSLNNPSEEYRRMNHCYQSLAKVPVTLIGGVYLIFFSSPLVKWLDKFKRVFGTRIAFIIMGIILIALTPIDLRNTCGFLIDALLK
jgi:uncharacterized membrane protein YraQ (UPF0718 family)